MFVTGLDARREYLQMTEPFATCTYRSSLHLIGSVLHTLEVQEIEKLNADFKVLDTVCRGDSYAKQMACWPSSLAV